MADYANLPRDVLWQLIFLPVIATTGSRRRAFQIAALRDVCRHWRDVVDNGMDAMRAGTLGAPGASAGTAAAAPRARPLHSVPIRDPLRAALLPDQGVGAAFAPGPPPPPPPASSSYPASLDPTRASADGDPALSAWDFGLDAARFAPVGAGVAGAFAAAEREPVAASREEAAKYYGVSLNNGKYRAHPYNPNTQETEYIDTFSTAEEAAKAVDDWLRKKELKAVGFNFPKTGEEQWERREKKSNYRGVTFCAGRASARKWIAQYKRSHVFCHTEVEAAQAHDRAVIAEVGPDRAGTQRDPINFPISDYQPEAAAWRDTYELKGGRVRKPSALALAAAAAEDPKKAADHKAGVAKWAAKQAAASAKRAQSKKAAEPRAQRAKKKRGAMAPPPSADKKRKAG